MANFKALGSRAKGTLVNVYGPSAYLLKKVFLDTLKWLNGLAREGTLIIGWDINLITSLRLKREEGRPWTDTKKNSWTCWFVVLSLNLKQEMGCTPETTSVREIILWISELTDS